MSDENAEMLDCLDGIYQQLKLRNSREARRDRFAAAALTGLLSGTDEPFYEADGRTAGATMADQQRIAAMYATGFADALLAALDAGGGK